MLFSAQLLLEIEAYFTFEIMACKRCLRFRYADKEQSETCWESQLSFPTLVLVLRVALGTRALGKDSSL